MKRPSRYCGSALAEVETEVGRLKSPEDGFRTSAFFGKKDGKRSITDLEGFDGLKPYTGETTQWKDWRLKFTVWLAQVEPLFETLLQNIDKMEKGSDEPEGEEGWILNERSGVENRSTNSSPVIQRDRRWRW